jgi:cytochrome c2
MKKFTRFLIILLAVIIISVSAFLLYFNFKGIPHYKPGNITEHIALTPQRIERGNKLSAILCADCHANKKGVALTGRELTEADDFGRLFSSNITQDKEHGIGGWTDGELKYLLRTGIKRDGSYAPVWMPKLCLTSEEDVNSIIAYLRSDDAPVKADPTPSVPCEPNLLAKILSNLAFPATMFPYPDHIISEPDTNNKIAWGKYLLTSEADCYQCHSASFKSNDYFNPEKSVGYLGGGNALKSDNGDLIYSANITMDKETGIGNWSRSQFIKAVRFGQLAGGKTYRYPMVPRPILDSNEVSAIWDYLQTVTPLKHAVKKVSP